MNWFEVTPAAVPTTVLGGWREVGATGLNPRQVGPVFCLPTHRRSGAGLGLQGDRGSLGVAWWRF